MTLRGSRVCSNVLSCIQRVWSRIRIESHLWHSLMMPLMLFARLGIVMLLFAPYLLQGEISKLRSKKSVRHQEVALNDDDESLKIASVRGCIISQSESAHCPLSAASSSRRQSSQNLRWAKLAENDDSCVSILPQFGALFVLKIYKSIMHV